MDTKELISQLAGVHNALHRMPVSGDNTIVVGDCLKTLRSLLVQLNEEQPEPTPEQGG